MRPLCRCALLLLPLLLPSTLSAQQRGIEIGLDGGAQAGQRGSGAAGQRGSGAAGQRGAQKIKGPKLESSSDPFALSAVKGSG
jgi:hypothetical protein